MASRREGSVMTDFIDLIMSSSNRSRRDVLRLFQTYGSVNNVAKVRVALYFCYCTMRPPKSTAGAPGGKQLIRKPRRAWSFDLWRDAVPLTCSQATECP